MRDLVGAGWLVVPLGPVAHVKRRSRRIYELLGQGLNHLEVARQLGCHVRTVERHARRLAEATAKRPG